MTPFFWAMVGILTTIGGAIMTLAGAPKVYLIVALVVGSVMILGSLIVLLSSTRK